MIGRILLSLAVVGLLASQAEARIFGRGGCSTGGCSTSGCSTGQGCSTGNQNTTTATDDFRFVPISKPASRPDVTIDNRVPHSPPIAGPAGKDGMPGRDGINGANGKDAEVTQAQLDFIANHVLEQMRQDPNFRGPQGLAGTAGRDGKDGSSVDVPTLVAAIVPELPPIRVEFQGPNNSIASTQVVKIGGTIRVPPVVTATRSANGELASVTKALGDTTTLIYAESR